MNRRSIRNLTLLLGIILGVGLVSYLSIIGIYGALDGSDIDTNGVASTVIDGGEELGEALPSSSVGSTKSDSTQHDAPNAPASGRQPANPPLGTPIASSADGESQNALHGNLALPSNSVGGDKSTADGTKSPIESKASGHGAASSGEHHKSEETAESRVGETGAGSSAQGEDNREVTDPAEADALVLGIARRKWKGEYVGGEIKSSTTFQGITVALAAFRLIEQLIAARTGNGPSVEGVGLDSSVLHTLIWIGAHMPSENAETMLFLPVHQRWLSLSGTQATESLRLDTIGRLPSHVSPALAMGVADTVKMALLAKHIEMKAHCPASLKKAIRDLALAPGVQGSSQRSAAEPWMASLLEWMLDRDVNAARNPSELESGHNQGLVDFLEACFPESETARDEQDEEGDSNRELYADHIEIPEVTVWSLRLKPHLVELHEGLLSFGSGSAGGGGGMRYLRSGSGKEPKLPDPVFVAPDNWLNTFHSRVRNNLATMDLVRALDNVSGELSRDLGRIDLGPDELRRAALEAVLDANGRSPGSLEADCDIWYILALSGRHASLKNEQFQGPSDPRRKLLSFVGGEMATKFARIVRGTWRDTNAHQTAMLDGIQLILRAEGAPDILIGAAWLALQGIPREALTPSRMKQITGSLFTDIDAIAPRLSPNRQLTEYAELLSWIATNVSTLSVVTSTSVDEEGTMTAKAMAGDTFAALETLAALSTGATPSAFRGLRSEDLWRKVVNAIAVREETMWTRSTRLKLLFAGWDV